MCILFQLVSEVEDKALLKISRYLVLDGNKQKR